MGVNVLPLCAKDAGIYSLPTERTVDGSVLVFCIVTQVLNY